MKTKIYKPIQKHAFQKLLKITSIILIALVFGNTVQAQSPLCASGPTSYCCEYISALSINSISQAVASDFSSGASNLGYYDFTSSSISTLTAGSTYPVTVTVVTSSSYTEYVKLWFDFNGNGVLSDAGELVFDQNKTFAAGGETLVYSGNITVPLTAFNGDIYIRIMMVYNAVPTLCGGYSYGNTVDLKATITGGVIGRTLTIARAGTGSGDVVSTPSGINTGSGQNSAIFADGTSVSLAATPVSPSLLTAWSGDASGSANPLEVTMNAAKNITATFDLASSPSVTTTAISSITSTTASSGGNVTSDGGAAVTARGVCWKTSGSPTTADSKTTDGTGTGAFSSSITGLTDGVTYYVRAYATNSIGTAYGGEVSFVSTNTWDGSTDTDWGTADNWSDNAVPTSLSDAVIPSGQTVIISPATSASCADLSNSGTLTIQSNASSSGSLIVSGTSTGNITYQRYVTGSKWHLVGSPVTGQDIGDLLLNASNDILLSGSDYSMKDYIENTDNWSASYTASTDGDFTLGKGYVTKRNSNGVISFTGTVNTSSVTRILSRSSYGWTLVSNPYTSAIGVTASAASGNRCLSDANIAIMDASYAALYLWDEQAGYTGSRNDYKTISNAGGGISQHYVQVGQGFFVRSKSGGGNFEFTTGMQIHQSATDFKSTEDIWPTIRLNVQSDDMSSYTQVCYHEDMTRGLDVSYDAGMLKANPNFALYSRLVEDNGVDFAMQCLPEDYEYLVIPIGIDAPSGTALTFTAETINLPEDYRVVIEDRKLGIFTTLETSEDYYSATISAFDDLSRFFLHTKSSYLAIEDPELNDGLQIIPQPQNHLIQVIGEVGDNAQLLLYDMTGRILLTTMLGQTEMNEVKVGSLKSGTYVIIIRSETKNSSKKLNWIQ